MNSSDIKINKISDDSERKRTHCGGDFLLDVNKTIINCFECSYRCLDDKRVRFIMTTPMKYSEVEQLLQRYKDYAVYTISEGRADFLREHGVRIRADYHSDYC